MYFFVEMENTKKHKQTGIKSQDNRNTASWLTQRAWHFNTLLRWHNFMALL